MPDKCGVPTISHTPIDMTMYNDHGHIYICKRVFMKEISKSQFKPKTLEYFRNVQETGEPLIITEYGKPVLKIMPYTPEPETLLQDLRGSVLSFEKPLEPVAIEDWDLLE